jgi:hypothetical protein
MVEDFPSHIYRRSSKVNVTSDRAREILEAGESTGEYRKHMPVEEQDQVYDIWSKMQRSSTFFEVLSLIARGQSR